MTRTALFVLILAFAAPLHAQQVVIADVTYTATASNTDDSHYRIDPAVGTPDDWQSPVDYAHGRAHVRFEVLEKPSAAVTLLNVCFEATPSYACMPYSDPYTTTGVYDFEHDFEDFYQYSMVDWSQGTNRIALILKDEGENKPQADPDFYPTRMRVTITLVAAGATFVPPVEGEDAGLMEPLDAGVDAAIDAAVEDASIMRPVTGGVGGAGGAGGGAAGIGGAGGMMAPPSMTGGAGGTGGAAGSVGSGGAGGVVGGAASAATSDGGCSSAPRRAPRSAFCLACFAFAAFALRRVRKPRR